MTTRPRLVPLASTRGSEAPLSASPFWVGSGAGCGLRLHHPGVADRHVALLEREDGIWLVPVRAVHPVPRVNGSPVAAEVRLRPGDVVELVPGASYRFATGERVVPPPAPALAPDPTLSPPRRPRLRDRIARRLRRRSGSGLLSPSAKIAIVAALLLVIASGALLVRAFRAGSAARPMSEEDAEYFDALTLTAFEHVERGTSLLELGLADPALKEFARALNTLEASRLHDDRAVRRSVAALESAIAEIYRAKRIRIPGRYAVAPRTTTTPRPTMRGAMSPEQFAERFARVQQRFSARFSRPLVVTGRDHAEHLSLYGPGSALDLRVRDLLREQVAFAVAAMREEGIRVKDFSDDAILRAQIRSARAAGLSERAGTGLHLHVDRFPNRRDRWTVQ
ncbi:MAG TPA: FHA domain-containing protein [Longimicrobium sp.]|jgi:hypothetical protein